MSPTWTKNKHSKKDIDKAGKLLSTGLRSATASEITHSIEVISNWRAAHAFPLNTFQMGLRHRAQKIYPSALIAQRLKRLPTMIDKLRRMPTTPLSRFQDIGGCRAVVQTMSQLVRLLEKSQRSRMKHRLVRTRDYVATPRESGYRCFHLVYKFVGRDGDGLNGLHIEVQLRTQLQHAWATAVETVGTVVSQSLKSSEGSEEWLEFFAAVGSAFAFLERTPPVPNTSQNPAELLSLIRQLENKLSVREKLNAFRHALRATEADGAKDDAYFLLSLDPKGQELEITAYSRNSLEQATKAYADKEKDLPQTPGAQVVLVGSHSFRALRKAYPNYFLDTELFLGQLERAKRRLSRSLRWPTVTPIKDWSPRPTKQTIDEEKPTQGEFWPTT